MRMFNFVFVLSLGSALAGESIETAPVKTAITTPPPLPPVKDDSTTGKAEQVENIVNDLQGLKEDMKELKEEVNEMLHFSKNFMQVIAVLQAHGGKIPEHFIQAAIGEKALSTIPEETESDLVQTPTTLAALSDVWNTPKTPKDANDLWPVTPKSTESPKGSPFFQGNSDSPRTPLGPSPFSFDKYGYDSEEEGKPKTDKILEENTDLPGYAKPTISSLIKSGKYPLEMMEKKTDSNDQARVEAPKGDYGITTRDVNNNDGITTRDVNNDDEVTSGKKPPRVPRYLQSTISSRLKKGDSPNDVVSQRRSASRNGGSHEVTMHPSGDYGQTNQPAAIAREFKNKKTIPNYLKATHSNSMKSVDTSVTRSSGEIEKPTPARTRRTNASRLSPENPPLPSPTTRKTQESTLMKPTKSFEAKKTVKKDESDKKAKPTALRNNKKLSRAYKASEEIAPAEEMTPTEEIASPIEEIPPTEEITPEVDQEPVRKRRMSRLMQPTRASQGKKTEKVATAPRTSWL